MRAPSWTPAALVTAAAVVVLCGPALRDPAGVALGSDRSEAPAHVWALWATLSQLGERGGLAFEVPLAFPDGVWQPSTNPANLLVAAPVWLLAGGGPAAALLAWNALHVAAIVLGGWGAWALARRLLPGAGGWTHAALVAAVAFNSFSLLQPWSGRAEYFTVALWPAHLALLLGFVEEGRPRLGVGAAVLLALAALGGPYLGPFLALVEVPVAIGLLAARRDRATLLRLVAVGFGAGLLVAPFGVWLVTRAFPGTEGFASSGLGPGSAVPLTRVLDMLRLTPVAALSDAAREGRDLLVHDAGQLDAFAYPGAVAVLLGLLGAALRPRRLGWLLLTAWVLVLSLGPLVAGPEAAPGLFTLPAKWLSDAAPVLTVVRNWARIGCLLGVPVGVAAMLGVEALAARLGRAGPVVGLVAVALLVGDLLTYPAPWARHRATFDPRPPTAVLDALDTLPDGAVLGLPVTDLPPGTAPRIARVHQLWQLAHGRPSSATVDVRGDVTLLTSRITRLDVLARARGREAVEARQRLLAAAPDLVLCLRVDAHELREAGYAAIVLARAAAPSPGLEPALRAALGEPVADAPDAAVWDLAAVPPAVAGTACPLPNVPMSILPPEALAP